MCKECQVNSNTAVSWGHSDSGQTKCVKHWASLPLSHLLLHFVYITLWTRVYMVTLHVFWHRNKPQVFAEIMEEFSQHLPYWPQNTPQVAYCLYDHLNQTVTTRSFLLSWVTYQLAMFESKWRYRIMTLYSSCVAPFPRISTKMTVSKR